MGKTPQLDRYLFKANRATVPLMSPPVLRNCLLVSVQHCEHGMAMIKLRVSYI